MVGDLNRDMKTKQANQIHPKMALITVVVFYLISFGPFVCLAAYMGWDNNRTAMWAGIVYLPHGILAIKSDAYNRYTAWWLGLADPELAADFREGFVSGSMIIEL